MVALDCGANIWNIHFLIQNFHKFNVVMSNNHFKHSMEQYRCGQFGHFTCKCCVDFTGQQSGYGNAIDGFWPDSRLTFSSAVSSGL